MLFNRLVDYFMPPKMLADKTHPQHDEFRVVVSSILIALPLIILFPLGLQYLHKPALGYWINGGMLFITILCVKFLGHYRMPMSITALVTYYIVYEWIRDSGYIYSSNLCILHMYLLGAIWADKKYGWWAIFSNLAVFIFLYYQTLGAGLPAPVGSVLGGALYALLMNALITIFLGGFLAWQQYDQERNRVKIRTLQDQKITVLDRAVKERTEQLRAMRESIATDFHDETGNMLSAITRQAGLLKLKLQQNDEAKPMVESIIDNSKRLYAGSKDFLWHLNHDSDDPQEVFNYLTAYGQQYYNQFDIAFSSEGEECRLQQFGPSAAIHIIFIFKEAMTNIVKHAGATEVQLSMHCTPTTITYALHDNGNWKEADDDQEHYGLSNMQRRCTKNNFILTIDHTNGTQIGVEVPTT